MKTHRMLPILNLSDSKTVALFIENRKRNWGFPGSPVVESPSPSAGGLGLTPGQGTKILHATQHDQKIKKEEKKIGTGREESV